MTIRMFAVGLGMRTPNSTTTPSIVTSGLHRNPCIATSACCGGQWCVQEPGLSFQVPVAAVLVA